MRLGHRAVLSFLIVGLLLCGLVLGPGCRTEQRSTTVHADQPDDERGGQADTMAGSDAERAKADLDRYQHREKNRRPAAPPTRSGARAVDQPRSGTPRP
ncbi:MAG: hypothetical protein ABIG44_09890 [Planctomycetota bacterium]